MIAQITSMISGTTSHTSQDSRRSRGMMICEMYSDTSSSCTMRRRHFTPSTWNTEHFCVFSMNRSRHGSTTFRWLSSDGTMHSRQCTISVAVLRSVVSSPRMHSMCGSTYTRYSLNSLWKHRLHVRTNRRICCWLVVQKGSIAFRMSGR